MELGGGVYVAIADDIICCIKPEAVLPAFMLIEERFRTRNGAKLREVNSFLEQAGESRQY